MDKINSLKVFKGKKILITGNTGFKGAWLTLFLSHLEAKVYGFSDKVLYKKSLFEEINKIRNYKTEFANIKEFKNIKNIIKKINPDFIFHLAAQSIVSKSYADPLETYMTNALGTANILNAINQCNIKKKLTTILITSDKCYENIEQYYGYRENDRLGGQDPYSASKACAEIIISSYVRSFFKKKKNLRFGVARAGNVIGGGDWTADRVIPDCYRAWYINKKVLLRSPSSTRPWQHVLDPLHGYLSLEVNLHTSNKIKNGEAFNFGPEENKVYDVLRLVERLAYLWKSKTKKKHENLIKIFKKKRIFQEAGLLQLNISKANHLLNWKPVLSFEQTCQFTSEWYVENYFNLKNKKKKNAAKLSLMQIIKFMELLKKK